MPRPKLAADPALIALVDEIGDLEKELAPYKPKAARLELLRKALRKRYDDSQADAFYTVEGARFTILIGEKANETKVNIGKLFKLVGAIVFQRVATVTLTAIDKECPHVRHEVTTLEATGTRSLKVMEKGKAA